MPRVRPIIGILAAVAAVLLVAGDATAQGCAMCKTALGGPGDPLARGINTSIYFMMAMPFALFAVVAGWLFYAFRQAGRGGGDGAGAERSEIDLVYTEREGAR